MPSVCHIIVNNEIHSLLWMWLQNAKPFRKSKWFPTSSELTVNSLWGNEFSVSALFPNFPIAFLQCFFSNFPIAFLQCVFSNFLIASLFSSVSFQMSQLLFSSVSFQISQLLFSRVCLFLFPNCLWQSMPAESNRWQNNSWHFILDDEGKARIVLWSVDQLEVERHKWH